MRRMHVGDHRRILIILNPPLLRKLARGFLTLLLAFLDAAPGGVALRGAIGKMKPANSRIPGQNDPPAVEYGKHLFSLNCASCHGVDGHGGRGPDLSSVPWLQEGNDARLFSTIKHGVPGTAMPATTFNGNDDPIWLVAAYVRNLVVKSSGSIFRISGNSQEGEKIFFGTGACNNCHMVNGNGGRLGPDLSRTGKIRSVRYLIESIREPRKDIADGYETVIAVTADGSPGCSRTKIPSLFSFWTRTSAFISL